MQREITPTEGPEAFLQGKARASSSSPRDDRPRTSSWDEPLPGVEEEGAVPGMYMTMEEIEAVLVASPPAFSPPAAFFEGTCILIDFLDTLYLFRKGC